MRRSFLRQTGALVTLFLTIVSAACALDNSKTLTQYTHRIWGQEEGLFQPTVFSIAQSSDGFLWLGTQDSLIRFDGAHFREFEHGTLIRSLAADADGNLWVGSMGNGLARISAQGNVRRYTTRNGLPSNNIFCLDSASKDGGVWACTEHGLVRIAAGQVRVIDQRPIRATCEATDGARWVAGFQFGLMRLGTPTGSDFAAPDAVAALLCGRDGTIWAGTSGGLLRISNGAVNTYTTHNGLPDNAVGALWQSRDGSVWIGTDDGISRFRNGEFNIYRTRDGLSHSVVLSLYTDREGSLWAGTKDGLDQFTNPKVTPYTTAEGMSSNQAGPIVEDAEGRLWIGTLNTGLNVFAGGRFRTLTEDQGLASNQILSLAVRGEDLWVGTARGLNRLQNGRVTETSLRGQTIRTLFVDENGVLWAGTDEWLFRSNAHSVFVPVRKANVLAIGSVPPQGLLVSSQPVRLDYLTGQAARTYTLTGLNRPITCYLPDTKSGAVWMGTLGSGLVRWRKGALQHVYVRDGLWDSRIYGMVRDGEANLWMASSKGIFRVPEQQLNDFAEGRVHAVKSIPFTTGQLRFECQAGVQPAACRTRDGKLWFATTSGLVVVDPHRLSDNRIPPPVRITSMVVNGVRREARNGLQLNHSEKNVEIRYAGLSFVSPEKVTFRYLLEPFDKTWTDAGTRREAFFTNLPPGTFHFRVLARNADGVWSTQAAAMQFNVEPQLYQRRWFFPALGALIALLILAGYRRRVRRIEQSFDLVLGERSRIARELHDTLLQGLSGITMQLQALCMRMASGREKTMLEEIIQDAGQCSAEARRSLWNLRTPGVRPASFSEKVIRLSREAVNGTRLHLDLQVPDMDLEGYPEIEYQLLRILHESITNVLKHAQATTLQVRLTQEERSLELTVQDNGRGFAPEAAYSGLGHFGLAGMRERAAEIAAELTIASTAAGSTIRVRVPLQQERGANTPNSEQLVAVEQKKGAL